MFQKRTLTAVGLALVLLLALVPLAMAQATPSVSASDQDVEDNTVTVDSVVSSGAGWIVIHRDDDGSPGDVIGHAAVEDGENTDVSVTLDEELAEETTLWAMLHEDTGTEGEYEFPDADPPAEDADGNVVMESFVATPAAMQEATPTAEPTDEMTPTATPESPETLPETGQGGSNTGLLFSIAGLLLLLGGGALLYRQRAGANA